MQATIYPSVGWHRRYDHFNIRFDSEQRAVWVEMKYPGRPCVSRSLLTEIQQVQQTIATFAKRGYHQRDERRLLYQILSSTDPRVFSLGGDLARLVSFIKTNDRESLKEYAVACIDTLYPRITSYGIPFTTISLVQGEALGGGFEAALSANVLIAEKSATFGFPEILFGLFPGMGAYSFLVRRLSPALAKRIIASGKVYTAATLYEMGVIDILAPDGQGKRAVHDFIKHRINRENGFQSLDQVIDQFNPITYQELSDIAAIWVDTAMQLSPKNLRLMEYLVQAQRNRQSASIDPEKRQVPIRS